MALLTDLTLTQARDGLPSVSVRVASTQTRRSPDRNSCANWELSYIRTGRRCAGRRAGSTRGGSDGGESLPLSGIPISIKDNIETRALPTTAATGALVGRRPRGNAPVVQRVLDEGALLAGKANMHELAFGITGNNRVTGPARNPYDPTMISGGSSSGNAVALAARIVPAGLGTDTGGSLRIPAALCGIVGFRPTVGRYPNEGMIRLSYTRDTAGPMARTVADVAILDGVLAGAHSNF